MEPKLTMTPQEFSLRRICNLAGEDFDPNSDEQVVSILKRKLNISLPQRRNLVESLTQTNSDHEIIELILRYRGALTS
jgi:DNA polymerase I-like protein with 3'-5' exonuclease and polymerase domains